VKNAADEEQVKGADKKTKSLREREIDDVRVLLALPAGRRFIWRYLTECHMFTTSFSSDAILMACAEGERNIGLKLHADILATDPESLVKMQLEHLKEEKKNG
jgi:hypothetical protein